MHSVKYNFIMNFITTGFSLVFPLITFPYVTRVLGAGPYGDYEFANSCANFFLLFAQLGVTLYGTRECAKVRDDKFKLARVSKELFTVTCIATAFVMIVYVAATLLVPAMRSRLLLMAVCGLNIPFTVLGVTWYFSATEQFAYVAVRTLAVRIAVLVGMFIFVRSSKDSFAWAVVSVVANSGAYLVNFVKLRKEQDWAHVGKMSLRRHVKPMFGFFLAMASISLYSSFSSVILGIVSTSFQVGFFSAALKIKNVLIAIMSSLTGVLVARASYYIGKEDKSSYLNVVSKSVHFAFIVIVYLAFLLALYAEPIVLFLAGGEYSGAVVPTQIMMLAAVSIGFSSITANEILTPLGKEGYLSLSYLIAGGIGIVLNFLFIPRYGAVGAATATAFAESAVFFIQVVLVLRKTTLTPSSLLSGCSKCGFSLLVACGLATAIRFVFGNTITTAIGSGVVGACASLLLLVVLREPLGLEFWDIVRRYAHKFCSRLYRS